jgi:alpha-glucoside transport system permease protein
MKNMAQLDRFLGRIPLHLVIIAICALWLLPTVGLLVTSFRPVRAVNETGWWMALASPRGSSEYNRFCASCHGSDGKAIEKANLADPELINKYRRSITLIALFNEEYDGKVHIEKDQRPDERQTADILTYLRRLAGLEERPTLTINNYVDALVGYRGRETYKEECQAGNTIPGERSCDFVQDMTTSPSGMGRAFINSMVVAIPATILPIIFAAFAAYAFAWLDFHGRQVLFAALVGLQVVPLQMTLIPMYKVYTALGLNGSFLGVWLFHTGFGLPYAIYLLRNFLGALPRDLFESAYLDGASQWTAFFRLAIPLSVPALASLGIFQFLWVWNDLLVALVFLGGMTPVLTYQISNLVTSLGGGWHLLTAAAFISMALPLLVFFSLQRYFVRGILAGSVKG